MRLQDLVIESARRDPGALAVRDAGAALTYGELDRLADRYAAALAARGVVAGDRVVIWTAKSVEAVALMQGCLRRGAVYVPLAGSNPVARVELVATRCRSSLVVVDNGDPEWAGADAPTETWCGITALADEGADARTVPEHHRGDADDLAYILYTSGSTGEPKGVCLSHTNALAFVRWACAELGVGPGDRLSNHAPFNFDLSVFDLYGAFHSGASVHLIGSEAAYAPEQIVRFLVERAITVWYSVPSALALMITKGGLLDTELPHLRCCVFAGEPFAVEHVRQLRRAWPGVRMFNWYGPTETNVSSSYEVGALETIPDEGLPIGRSCSGDSLELVPEGSGTELVVSGPTVMLGYWDGPRQVGGYRTGDLVRRDEHGDLEYVGRRDHMVKIRGHRVELTEVETVLTEHESVDEALVVVVGHGLGAELHAVLVPSTGGTPPTLLAVKRHSALRLPTYMLVDAVHLMDELPRTANGKRDRAAAAEAIESGRLA